MNMPTIRCCIATLAALALAARAEADGLSQDVLARCYERLAPAMGLLTYTSEVTNPSSGEMSKREGNALALVVSADGLVMSHGHMLLENSVPFNIVVTLGHGDNEKKYDATLLKKPEDLNVVFMRLESDKPLNLPCASFTNPSGLALASPVAIFGLLGEPLDYAPTFDVQRIAAVLEKPRRTFCLEESVRFGYVGGPVVDAQGRTVGVVGFDLSANEGGDVYVRSGHPLVYQVELFQKYLNNPPAETDADAVEDDAWLGVFTQPLTEDFARYWELDRDGGLIVSTVVPGSPAAQAGMQTGDIITEFDGTPIRARLDRDVIGFTKLVRETGAGKEVPVKLLRDGESLQIRLTLGARPRSSQDANEFEESHFGLTVREITTDVRIALNLPENVQGVIVRRVRSGSPAQLAKIRPGVVILAINEHPTGNLEEFESAIEKTVEARPKEVAIFARVGSATGFFRLEPRWEKRE